MNKSYTLIFLLIFSLFSCKQSPSKKEALSHLLTTCDKFEDVKVQSYKFHCRLRQIISYNCCLDDLVTPNKDTMKLVREEFIITLENIKTTIVELNATPEFNDAAGLKKSALEIANFIYKESSIEFNQILNHFETGTFTYRQMLYEIEDHQLRKRDEEEDFVLTQWSFRSEFALRFEENQEISSKFPTSYRMRYYILKSSELNHTDNLYKYQFSLLLQSLGSCRK